MFNRTTMTVIGRTHGLADDAIVLDRLVRSQSRAPEQILIMGAPDRRVQALFLRRTGRTAYDLQFALLRTSGDIVVVLDSAYDVLPDHLETIEQYVLSGVLPIPKVYGVDGQPRDASSPVPHGSTFPAFRRKEALGVGGFWAFLDRSDGPEVWGLDLLTRIAGKYGRELVTIPVHVGAIAGRSSPRFREDKCGLVTYAVSRDEPVTANRSVSAKVLERLESPCPFFATHDSSCSLLNGPCVASWSAFGVPDSVVKWARSLPRGRIRRAWHAAKAK